MGSLFKVRDWWSTKCGDNEEFDKKCLAVGNVDNDSTPSDKIVVGSWNGVLRVFQPKQKGYKPDDLLLEQELEAPILQLAIGRFLSTQPGLALGVLHPRKLVVYIVARSGGGGEGAADPLTRQFTVQKQYEHPMERTAYNMVHGSFGNVYGKDLICVQSMDGQIQFFEQDKPTFARFFHNFLVPGHLCYCQKIDSFVTNTSSYDIECYKYSNLATSSGSEEKEEKKEGAEASVTPTPTPGVSGKRISPQWTVNIGEDVVDIRVAKFNRQAGSHEADVLVLAERALYVLQDSGKIRQVKRLDYFSSCLYPYVWNKDSKICNILVGTYNDSVQIYSDTALMWAARTQAAPVCLEVATIARLEGMIVLLTAEGHVSVNYLGTDPASNPVQILESKELDYEEMDEEHRRLQALIRQAVNAGKAEPKDQVVLRAQVPSQLDAGDDGFSSSGEGQANQRCVTVKLFLSYTGDEDIENAVHTVSVPHPIHLEEQSILIPSLKGSGSGSVNTPMVVPLPFYLPENASGLLPTSLSTTCLVAYTNPNGEPLTTKTTFLLPLSLAGCVIPPVKNPAYKITLDTNRMPPQLQVLYEDILAGKGELAQAGNVLTFQYYNSNGADVTILVSKNAGRYRIQSGNFEALWLLTSELVRRMKLHFGEEGVQAPQVPGEEPLEPFCISYADNLPFQEYFAAIDAHFKARQTLTASQQVLSERAHQFRSIQKRLLVRFKDRNPSPLANLDLLFEDTYRQLINISEKVEKDQQQLQHTANVLTCSTNLMLLLIRYRFQMKKEDFKVLQHYLSPVVVDSQTQGWEECTDAAMTHLLRTCLAKNAKESSSMPQPLQVPNDINKLKKHIALVCDRLAKGGSLRMENKKQKL